MSRSRDEDRQLGSTVDGRLHRVRAPTIPAALYSPIELASSCPGGRLDWDRWIDVSAIGFDTLPQVGVAEIHV
jgi:hypothetical protein